eukprot:7342928-Ditylum_brightwellii.AAC.1
MKSKTCIQNMNKCMLLGWPNQAVEMLELEASGYSGTWWHRSGATSMANSGAGIINLKRAGGKPEAKKKKSGELDVVVAAAK